MNSKSTVYLKPFQPLCVEKNSTMREGSGSVYICQHAYNKNQSLLPLNHLGPHPSLGVAKRTVRLHLHRLHGLRARREREPPPGGQDCHLGLQQGEPHPDAGSRALTKGLEGVPGNKDSVPKDLKTYLRNIYGFLAAFSSLLKCSGQNSSGWEKCSGSS